MALPTIAPRVLTEQEKNEAVVRRLLSEAQRALLDLAKKHKELFELFWKNPQAYCDVLGTGAVGYFSESGRTQTYLSEALGDKFLPFQCAVPADKIYTANEDGTVTISNKEPVNE
jgi:hypothetical protein